ncbi:transposase [Desulfocucumis palustris]|uniref:Transposase n=1 Tax=Desulfocucumis palustris TaxID=1898651 RepID=A0A2L2XIV2_9FIRM|nr:transposase [Desulfocucumis palustris]GBF35633.1 transposase [Desulfocucumis palustris]
MPRQAREKSRTGIYHVMSRGINGQEIFNDDKDRLKYLETLYREKLEKSIEIYGYCLMGNHLHLLVKEDEKGLGAVMKKIGTRYARWYNWKYKRRGYVFQDRYRSECVNDDAYLLTVIRYIHLNPTRAYLVNKPESWKWSSCGAYYGMQEYPSNLTETALILGIFSADRNAAVSKFMKYMEEANSDKCLEHEEIQRKTDEQVREEILRLMQCQQIQNIQSMSKEARNNLLRDVKAIEGTTYRQLARILGISTYNIVKAK